MTLLNAVDGVPMVALPPVYVLRRDRYVVPMLTIGKDVEVIAGTAPAAWVLPWLLIEALSV